MTQILFDKSDEVINFDDDDLSIFSEVSNFFYPNPQKIMRITNTYRINRLIAATKFQSPDKNKSKLNSLKKKILMWVVLIEQWPVRISWLLQVLEDEDQQGSILNIQNECLGDFYKKYIELRIYNSNSLSGCPVSLLARYEKVLSLDADPEVFENLLRASNILVKDIGSFSERNFLTLLPYSIGLNPAIRSIIGGLAAYRPDEINLTDAIKPRFLLSINKINSVHVFNRLKASSVEFWIRSVFKKGLRETQVSVATIAERIIANNIDGPLMHRIICGGSMDITCPSPDYDALAGLGVEDRLLQQVVISEWCQWIDKMSKKQKYASGKTDLESAVDDMDSNASPRGQKTSQQLLKLEDQHVGYLDYAVAFAALIRYGVTAPVVLGLYSVGGSGKSYLLEFVYAAIKTLWLLEKMGHIKGIEFNRVPLSGSDKLKSNENDSNQNQLIVGYENLPDDEESVMLTSLYNSSSYNSCSDANACSGDGSPFQSETISDEGKGVRSFSISSSNAADMDTPEQLLQEIMCTQQDSIHDIFLWYKLGCPHETFLKSEGFILDRSRLHSLLESRSEDFSWPQALFSTCTGCVSCFASLLLGACRSLFTSKSSDPLASRDGRMFKCLRDAREEIARERELASSSSNKARVAVTTDYEFTRWNAWLYSGSDNLWAGLIKALYESVEEHYGPNYKHAHQKSKLLMTVLLCVVSITCLTRFTWSGMDSLKDSDVESVVSLMGAILSAAIAVLAQLYSQLKPSEKVLSMVESDDFKSKLGFMASIKEEIQKIGNLLKDPESVPTMWDLFFGWTGPLKPSLKYFCEKYLGGGLNLRYLNPCELVICVDELDRCPPALAVDVLRSLVLLTEDTPFVILLTVDPRLIVSAIESENSSFYSEAGVSGYEYLDKIVSMPFAIPQMVNVEKRKFCESYLAQQKVDVLLSHNNRTYSPTSTTNTTVTTETDIIFSMKSKALKRSIKELQLSVDCHNRRDQEVELSLLLFKEAELLHYQPMFGKFKGGKRDKVTLRANSPIVFKATKDCHFEVVCKYLPLESSTNNGVHVKNIGIGCKYH